MATLSSDERAVSEAIWIFLDDSGTQHVPRDDLLELFLLDTTEVHCHAKPAGQRNTLICPTKRKAIDLFGTMSKLLTPIHQPSGCVLSDWMEFLRKLKAQETRQVLACCHHSHSACPSRASAALVGSERGSIMWA